MTSVEEDFADVFMLMALKKYNRPVYQRIIWVKKHFAKSK